MLRGVNKNIIEIVETDNQYFEKAILFVRQGQRSDLLQGKAMEYVAGISPSQPAPAAGVGVQVKAKPLLARTWVRVAIGVVAAVAVGLLFL